MKDYEITIKLQVQANDSTNDDEVLSEIMSRVNLSASLIDADREIAVNDIYKNIICLNVLSDGANDGYEKYDELVNFLKRESAHTEWANERLRQMSAAMGMKDEDYQDKPKQKPQRQQKTVIKDVSEVFAKCSVSDNILHLPTEQLDRKIYEDVKKQLEAVGGKWKGGKTQGFVFADTIDANDILKQLQSGKDYAAQKKEFQFFGTPESVADEIISHVELTEGMKILEPSAGRGSLIKALQKQLPTAKVDAYEAMPENRKYLEAL